MHACIRLEAIGDNLFAEFSLCRRKLQGVGLGEYAPLFHCGRPRPWVARITGTDPRYGLQREFLRGQKDYADANSVGSRGVYVYYPLPPGVYEVQELISWSKVRRYFVRSAGGRYEVIDRETVLQKLAQGVAP